MNVFQEHTIENRTSEQKRAEIQLGNSNRTIEKRSVRRPADASLLPNESAFPLLLTIAVMVGTLLLLTARLTERPTALPELRTAIANWRDSDGPGPQQSQDQAVPEADVGSTIQEPADALDSLPISDALALDSPEGGDTVGVPLSLSFTELFADDFSRPNSLLAENLQDKQWDMGFPPGENIYRLRVWPGYTAWSTLGVELPTPFRVETSVIVLPDTPRGYAGLIARYQDERNFYLFAVDGDGQTQMLQQINGEWITASQWMPTVNARKAGQPNTLMIEDDGQSVRFFVNGRPIHEAGALLPPGAVGLVGGTRDQFSPAESNFEWIRIYGTP